MVIKLVLVFLSFATTAAFCRRLCFAKPRIFCSGVFSRTPSSAYHVLLIIYRSVYQRSIAKHIFLASTIIHAHLHIIH
uniref:Putative secreted protein n=1 Tax=Anopheles darlingi TaxID=43151 RepID=A0A2M4D494_ANODA